jgi:hypothetical protein
MKTESAVCPVSRVAQLLGDHCSLLIVRDLLGGTKRFCELERSLEHVSTRTLTLKLKHLEHDCLASDTPSRLVSVYAPASSSPTSADERAPRKPILIILNAVCASRNFSTSDDWINTLSLAISSLITRFNFPIVICMYRTYTRRDGLAEQRASDRQAQHHEHNAQRNEHEEQDLGDISSTVRYAGEPEQASDDRDDREEYGPT